MDWLNTSVQHITNFSVLKVELKLKQIIIIHKSSTMDQLLQEK